MSIYCVKNDGKTLYKQSKQETKKKTVINCFLTLNKLKKGLFFIHFKYKIDLKVVESGA